MTLLVDLQELSFRLGLDCRVSFLESIQGGSNPATATNNSQDAKAPGPTCCELCWAGAFVILQEFGHRSLPGSGRCAKGTLVIAFPAFDDSACVGRLQAVCLLTFAAGTWICTRGGGRGV